MASHGNSGYRIKNLRGTSGCPHYRGHEAPAEGGAKCAVNGCGNAANRACHVISANQSAASGARKLVYMCASHNGQYAIHSIRLNAYTVDLPTCKCGVD